MREGVQESREGSERGLAWICQAPPPLGFVTLINGAGKSISSYRERAVYVLCPFICHVVYSTASRIRKRGHWDPRRPACRSLPLCVAPQSIILSN